MKVCRKCKIEKSNEDFYTSVQTLDKLSSYCKTCAKMSAHDSRQRRTIEIKKYYASYYSKNKEKIASKVKANPEKAAKRAATWRMKNPEKAAAIYKKYLTTHRAFRAAKQKIREDAKRSPISLSYEKEILKFYEMAEDIGHKTGTKHHVDHIVPLQGKTVCGLHVPWNLQVIPAIENIRKGNKFHVQEN